MPQGLFMTEPTSHKTANRKMAEYKDRRLDEIACLIRGNSEVGAACLDGSDLILATNAEQSTPFVNDVINYLSTIADNSYRCNKYISTLNDREEVQKIRTEQEKWCQQLMTNFEQYMMKHVNLLIQKHDSYTRFFKRSLTKLTRSIRHTYLGRSTAKKYKPLQIELADALRDKSKKIIVVPSFVIKNKEGVITDKLNPHAELKILQALLNRGIDGKSYVIGVSKKCCENCEMSMKAVNDIKGSHINIKVTDEGSQAPFPADPPPFLLCDAKIADRYLQLIGAKFTKLTPSLVKESFKRYAGRHVSGAEQDPTSSDSIDVTSDPIESDNNNDEKPLYTDLIQMNLDKTNLTPSYNKILPQIKITTESDKPRLSLINSQLLSQSTETQKDSKREKSLTNDWLNGSERIKKTSENKAPSFLSGNSKEHSTKPENQQTNKNLNSRSNNNKSNSTEITDQSNISRFSS